MANFPEHCAPTKELYVGVVSREEFQQTGITYMDSAGRFPVKSRKGNEYCLILYSYDSNYIRIEPMKDNSGSQLLRAFELGHQFFDKRDCTPTLMFLDNYIPEKLRERLSELEVQYQIVPPHTHRRNAAERAIRTFKNHFISVLCTADSPFPLNLWDELLEQTERSLNLLRGSRIKEGLSAWAHLHGPFDFDKTPMAPAGTAVLIHEKPDDRKSWAPHGVKGYYIGPALHHYRCYRVWAIDTEATGLQTPWYGIPPLSRYQPQTQRSWWQ